MMTERRLVLEDKEGKVLRAFNWDGRSAQVIRRGDTRRLELVTETESLKKKKIPFEPVAALEPGELARTPLMIGELGRLKFVDSIETTLRDQSVERERDRLSASSFAALLLVVFGFFSIMANRPLTTPKIEEELKQQVVRIVKQVPKRAESVPTAASMAPTPAQQKLQQKVNSLKRSGALAVLGSLKSGSQRGGLNLGAVDTTAGPGLGGTQGSGGVQTSLYAKGIVGSPLGAGANIQGAGGYGTKGKGGGQAGYGKLSLTGSAGTNPIPLGQEASVATGLDRDQIADVINRNIGQVRFCYEQGLQSSPGLNGRVSVDFTIGGDGLVKAASVGNTSLNSKLVEDCIVMRLKTWKFPLPQGGVDVKVSYPFMLRRTGQG